MVKREPRLILLHGGKLGSNANVIPILIRAGHTYRSVGKMFGVTGQRVQQIAKKNNMLDILYLVAERKRAATRRLEMERIERMKRNKRGLTKWLGYGLPPEEQHRLKRLRTKYRNLKKKCDTLGIPINIRFEDLEWPTHCPVFGFELDYSHKSGLNNRDRAPSFDRILPSGGYTRGNVQIISYRANRIKNNATPEELRMLADYMCALTAG